MQPANSPFLTASCDPQAMSPAWGEILATVAEAGDMLRGYWRQALNHRKKEDGSPVSEADEAANAVLTAGLQRATPEIPIISEEGTLPESGWHAPIFWLLDPLDGTKAFLRGEGEFVISLGLIVNGQAHAGIIAAPVWKTSPMMGWGMIGQGAWLRDGEQGAQPIRTRNAAPQQFANEGVDLLVAYRGQTPEIDTHLHPVKERSRIPCSSALKFLRLAQGDADLYPRFGPTQQWDTAGGEGLLRAAGGEMSRMDGAPMAYGLHAQHGWMNPGFLATAQGGHAALKAAGARMPAGKAIAHA